MLRKPICASIQENLRLCKYKRVSTTAFLKSAISIQNPRICHAEPLCGEASPIRCERPFGRSNRSLRVTCHGLRTRVNAVPTRFFYCAATYSLQYDIRCQAPSRATRISISLSTYFHSSEARSSATNSSKAEESAGAYSNHVRKSNGSFSPRSRQ